MAAKDPALAEAIAQPELRRRLRKPFFWVLAASENDSGGQKSRA